MLAGHQDEWLGDELTRAEFAESEVLFRRLLETGRQRGLVASKTCGGVLLRPGGSDSLYWALTPIPFNL